jgi:acyl-CoA dehydrogenase
MDYRLTTEQALFQKTVREFCEAKIAPRSRAIDDSDANLPDDLLKEMADLGIFGVTIPEQYGGSAMPGEEMVYANIAVQEVARAELSMSLPVYTLLCLGWSYLVAKHGSEELKREVLPKVAAGEWFLGICTTEASGGSDLANITTSAKKVGDKWVINGDKVYVSGCKEAAKRGGGHLTLFKTAPELGTKGMAFAYVPVQTPGYSYNVLRDMGRGGLSTSTISYKNVEIPSKYVLGDDKRGFYMNMEGFNVARALVSAACVGGAERALEMSAEYVKQRVLFGQPLAKFQGISFEIADDRAELNMLQQYLQQACWMIDRFYAEPGSFSRKQINEAIAICKLKSPHLALDIVKHSMMYHGAFAFTKDCPLEMCLRGLMSYVVGAEGGANIMRIIIGREFIGDVSVGYK